MDSYECQAAALGKRVAEIMFHNRRYGWTISAAFEYETLCKLALVCPTARAVFDTAYRNYMLDTATPEYYT